MNYKAALQKASDIINGVKSSKPDGSIDWRGLRRAIADELWLMDKQSFYAQSFNLKPGTVLKSRQLKKN